ncbi:efflux RND transporter periplasmic adaptor subunit [uncultured Desulfuromusa sp.]|uniref:efflux RND transporter periplasmic adaptor subunit n=1 Tax=uncultured Desulfuromusa sp. TaxID=219183 RepID=UPI002AA7779D|nr:efflux RND transporter periplasmic adaptor subunit [uncultured Desulfuromusa sp.]
MKQEKIKSILLLGILLLPVISPPIIEAAPNKKSSPQPLVMVSTVTEQDINPIAEYVGHAEAVQTVDLQARVSGFLEQVHFKEGSYVQSGELLYTVEAAPYKALVAANKARVAKAQSILLKTSQHLQRIKAVRSGGVPVTDIETAEAAEQQARAELQEAQANLRLAEIDLEYTQISAPISGRIGATALSKGNLCGPGSGVLAQIVQLDPIRIQFSISENDASVIKTAQADAENDSSTNIMKPQLKLLNGQMLATSGRIDFVDNRVDPATGTVAVWALFTNPAAVLLPGQYVTVALSRSQRQLKPVVSQVAILEDRSGRYVLVVDEENKVERRRIKTGIAVGSFWVVEAGLQVGENVIIEGLQKVRPGQQVQTTTADMTKKD